MQAHRRGFRQWRMNEVVGKELGRKRSMQR
jgi:hypothetical protein